MKSRTIPPFWELFQQLPPQVQTMASKAYRIWRVNPAAHGLHFKRVCESDPIYSVRIGRGYRAVGLLEDDTVYWYFVGNHDEYERELKKL